MIYTYGITQRGHYHSFDHSVCQDAHRIAQKGKLVIAAVADGVGSEAHSDIASDKAVHVSVDYCMDHLDVPLEEEKVLTVMKEAFHAALQAIGDIAEENGHEADQYDTTLTLAAYSDGTLYYGHSGDSGIIVLSEEGLVEGVTEQQRDKNGYLYPLACGEERWVFGRYEKKAASVLLVTDGVLESLFPSELKDEAVRVYVAQACFFMDNEVLQFEKCGEDAVKDRIESYLKRVVAEKISDDLTVAVIVDTDQPIKRQEDNYYMIVDWEVIRKKQDKIRQRILYPHLYEEKEET